MIPTVSRCTNEAHLAALQSNVERGASPPTTPKAQPPGGLGRFDLHQDGGASRTRTGDLLGAIQALSQLSYSPVRTPQGRELTQV